MKKHLVVEYTTDSGFRAEVVYDANTTIPAVGDEVFLERHGGLHRVVQRRHIVEFTTEDYPVADSWRLTLARV